MTGWQFVWRAIVCYVLGIVAGVPAAMRVIVGADKRALLAEALPYLIEDALLTSQPIFLIMLAVLFYWPGRVQKHLKWLCLSVPPVAVIGWFTVMAIQLLQAGSDQQAKYLAKLGPEIIVQFVFLILTCASISSLLFYVWVSCFVRRSVKQERAPRPKAQG